jgi:hypothetical protein
MPHNMSFKQFVEHMDRVITAEVTQIAFFANKTARARASLWAQVSSFPFVRVAWLWVRVSLHVGIPVTGPQEEGQKEPKGSLD